MSERSPDSKNLKQYQQVMVTLCGPGLVGYQALHAMAAYSEKSTALSSRGKISSRDFLPLPPPSWSASQVFRGVAIVKFEG